MFWQSRNFRVRLVVAIGIIAIIVVGTFSPNAIVLRLVYTFAALVAMYEILMTSAINGQTSEDVAAEDVISWTILPLLIFLVIVYSTIGIWCLPLKTILLLLLVSYGTDALGYLVGNFLGGKLIKAHPFPRTSPKKTWEGIFAGVLIPILILVITNCVWKSHDLASIIVDWLLIIGPFISILGDYTASRFKRVYRIKDSCDFIVQGKFMRYVEALLGGSNGHGGYLDRTDSLSFVATYAIIVYIIAAKFA